MNMLILMGLILGGGTIATDRWIRKIPNRFAIALYAIALLLMLAGMLLSKKAGG